MTDTDRFKHIVATLAVEHPDMTMRDGIHLALQLEERLERVTAEAEADPLPDPDNPADLARWTSRQADVKAVWDAGKRIDAIKLVRTRAGCGLKEAKDAALAAFSPPLPPF